MKIKTTGFEKAERVIAGMAHPPIDRLVMKQLTDIYNRGVIPGTGTPKDTGELIQSMTINPPKNGEGSVGYTKEYAPYVEYGHRTRNGGFVEGQYFLRRNGEQQQTIFEEDILRMYETLMR